MGSGRLVTTAVGRPQQFEEYPAIPPGGLQVEGKTPLAGVQKMVKGSLLDVGGVSQERAGPAHCIPTHRIDADHVMARLREETGGVGTGQGS